MNQTHSSDAHSDQHRKPQKGGREPGQSLIEEGPRKGLNAVPSTDMYILREANTRGEEAPEAGAFSNETSSIMRGLAYTRGEEGLKRGALSNGDGRKTASLMKGSRQQHHTGE